MLDGEVFSTILRLSLALLAGGLVGFERSYHGRSAGFREHTLVCISACMLMLLADFHGQHTASELHREAFLDPTRMAQGIMTGIGFLGAGAIVKEGFAIRGLTTAASIWMIAAIGIMIGMGYFLVAGAATFATFNINYVFRLIEGHIRSESYAHFHVRFARAEPHTEDELLAILGECQCEASGISYGLIGDGAWFEYRMLIKTLDKRQLHSLAEKLSAISSIHEFAITPRGD